MLKPSPTNRPALYNLVADPGEAKDVAGDHADVSSRLDAILRRLAAPAQPPRNQAQAAP